MAAPFITFSFSLTIVVQFAFVKVCIFFYFLQNIYIFEKNGNNCLSDTSLYFLTVEKVAVSLPTKCSSIPASGSVLMGDYLLGHAHFPGQGKSNPIPQLMRTFQINLTRWENPR